MPPIIRPKALEPGHTVVIAALSSGHETELVDMYKQGAAELEALGFRVRAAPLVEAQAAWWWGPARPHDVARELNELFRDPEVHAIWALTGGKFAFSYLDAIDYDVVAANPKPLLGMSDITAVNVAVHSQTRLVTFQADALVFGVSEWGTLPGDYRRQLADAYRRVLTSTAPIGALPAQSTWETWRPGRVEGPLLGGMLNRFLRVQATPWALEPERFDGAILFLEDYSLPTLNIWHDLHVLRLGGMFDRIGGLIIGPTEGVQVVPEYPQSLRDVVLDVIGDRDIPILGNVNIGHAGPNIPLPLGIRAALDADARSIELLEGTVR